MPRIAFQTEISVEVMVLVDIEPPVAPRIGTPDDNDPGDPGNCDVLAVKVGDLNVADVLDEHALEELRAQAREAFEADDYDAVLEP